MKIFLWLFITALFCLILAVQRVEERRLGIEVARLEQEVSLKESQNQYLKYKISVLTSPAAIDKAAREKLNMQLTPVKNIAVIKNDD
ncbi:MAG: cell division protein FtsL [Elusimicrobium sp.]|jgi:cell division protein FtsL|nr:cell division protein FtsL [Elusimicrobium sp.]